MRRIVPRESSTDNPSDPTGVEWVDVDLEDPESLSWLEQDSSLNDETRKLLVNNEQRNRRFVVSEGLFLSLCYPAEAQREPGTEPIYRVGILVSQDRFITVRRHSIPAIEQLWETLQGETEILSSGWSYLSRLVIRVAAEVEWILDDTADEIDQLEDHVFEGTSQPPIDEIGKLRRQLILDRRHITALNRVIEETLDDHRIAPSREESAALASGSQLVIRQVRTVEFFLERANLIQDQIQSLLSDRINTATLRLGVVATVFLPLGFLTGLLGINVAGMPGSHNPIAFWVVCAILTVLAVGAWILVGRLHRDDLETKSKKRRSRDAAQQTNKKS
ncbi:MAG: CorA family divalent cation transporter [Myxococcota bacterium]|nr:CorA family divalent cation transporter [Myxococcota bacterium]